MKERRLEISVISLIICTIFWFAPFELFFVNINNFWFDAYELIPFALLGSVGTFCGLMILFKLLHHFAPKINVMAIFCLFSIVLALYLQGNYLIGEFGVLDGTIIEWSLYIKDAILSYILWGTMIGLGILLGIMYLQGKKQIGKIVEILSICLILIQVITLLTAGILNDGFKKSVMSVSTTEHQFDMSSEENMIVMILDSMDARAFERVLENTDSEDILEDFTWYKNAVGGYVYTDLSLPHIISGKHYNSEVTYKEYMTSAYNESPWLNKLYEEDWKINIYSGIEGPQGDLNIEIDNYERVNLEVSSKRRLTEYIYRLVGFRYLPFPLKQYCWFYPDEMGDMRSTDNPDLQVYDWSNFSFYQDMQNLQVTVDEPSMHLYHLDGSHIPYHITKEFELVQEETSLDEEIQGVFKLVDEFLLLLRDNGIYDNSTIVIMADHGFEGYRQSPLLCVKGKAENHEFQVSDKPLSYDDLQQGFCNLTDGMTALDAFDFIENVERERIFYSYDLDFSNNINEQRLILEEYSTNGHSFDDTTVLKVTP